MNDKDCIRFLLSKCVEVHNRFNGAVEETLRRGNGTENVESLIESIRYVADDMERLMKNSHQDKS